MISGTRSLIGLCYYLQAGFRFDAPFMNAHAVEQFSDRCYFYENKNGKQKLNNSNLSKINNGNNYKNKMGY